MQGISSFTIICYQIFNFNSLQLKKMQRTNSSHKQMLIRRKAPSIKSVQEARKMKSNGQKHWEKEKRIPEIINELEKNLKMLRKCYHDENSHSQYSKQSSGIRKSNRAYSSCNKVKKQVEEAPQQQVTVVAEIDDLKKSFLSMNGYETNNIVELYNFYKKNLQKSTRLFGSTSMSNMINLTHNHSEIRDKAIMRPSTSYVIAVEESVKDKQEKQMRKNEPVLNKAAASINKLPLVLTDNMIKRTNQMVNVATLLADKKKISRKNICENMNSQNLLNQAKRKLYRPNPNDNIERFYKLKQNLRGENIRISPGRKIKNGQNMRERSSSKKSNRKHPEQKMEVHENGQNLGSPIQNNKNAFQMIYLKQRSQSANQQIYATKSGEEVKVKELKSSQKSLINKLGSENQNQQSGKQLKQLKQLRSAKSSRSVKSIKSPGSIKSPSLNQAALLDITISGQPSSRRKLPQPSYFVPRVHTNPHDSLLDCEITPKEQSRLIDLESIPFDF